MGLFDRFKKKEKERKAIPDEVEIDEDQLILKKIATTSKDRYERAAAVNQITNEYVALDIAKTVKDRAIRLIAANKLKDERLLWDAAENSNFFDVRSFAYERLGENNKSIAEIVLNTKKNPGADEIFQKVQDEETLKWIAIDAIDKRYRKEAAEKIESEEVLKDLVFKSDDSSVKKIAINKDGFTDEDILQKIATDEKDEEVKESKESKKKTKKK